MVVTFSQLTTFLLVGIIKREIYRVALNGVAAETMKLARGSRNLPSRGRRAIS